MGSMPNPFIVDLTIDGIQMPMEIDTGASVSLIERKNFKKIGQKRMEGLISIITDIYWTYPGSERLC